MSHHVTTPHAPPNSEIRHSTSLRIREQIKKEMILNYLANNKYNGLGHGGGWPGAGPRGTCDV